LHFHFNHNIIITENSFTCLELALEIPIEKVTVCKEKSIVFHPEYKGIRLDVIAKDAARTHYNIEMQVAVKPALGRRTRYYHSQLDMELLEKGAEYQELADVYVIFICDYDPFGKELYRYTWDTICREDKNINICDGRHTIILSTCGKNDAEVPEALVKFLKFVGAGPSESIADYKDPYVRKLQDTVAHIKSSREMEARYMLLLKEWIEEEREIARKEARAEGLAEGLAEGRIEMVLEMLDALPGEISANLKARICKEDDVAVLKDYLHKIIKSSSIEDFEKSLDRTE